MLLGALLGACGGGGGAAVDGGVTSAADGGSAARDGGAGDGGVATGPLDNRGLFVSLSESIYHTADVAEQRALVDRFMAAVEQQGGFPVRGGNDVTFLYRGTVQHPPLVVVGSFNGWDPQANPFFQINGTDLWAATAVVGAAARHEYRYLDGDRALQDPHNHLVVWDGAEPVGGRGAFDSVLLMPEHVPTRGVLRYEPGLRDRWLFLPASYLRGDGTPLATLYVNDGNEAITAGQLDTVAETLMEAGTLPRLLLVFLDVDPARRTYDYTTGPATGGNAYVDELKTATIPDLERRYRMSGERGLLGAGQAGLITFHAARRHPGFWARLGAQSPDFSWDSQRLVADYRDGDVVPGRFYLDSGSPGDASAATAAMAAALRARGYTFQYDEVPGGTSTWASWRERSAALLRYLFPTP